MRIISREQLFQTLLKKQCINCNGDVRVDIEFNKIDIKIIFHFICKNCEFNGSVESPVRAKDKLEKAFFEIVGDNIKEKGFAHLTGVL